MTTTDTSLMHLGGTGRPEDLPDHMPYVCATTGRVCIDRVPCTQEEIRDCGDALQRIYVARSGAA